MARDKEDTAEYDARLDREGKKLDNNNFVARWNPYLKDQAIAANVNLQNELTTLRKQRQESVGAGRGEVNPPNAYKKGGKVGLYANIHAKQKRIAAGSGEKMRKPGSKGAPTKQSFINSAKTARKK